MYRVCITTYNRTEQLKTILNDIALADKNVKTMIFDDGSKVPHYGALQHQHHGKRKYYQLITKVFEFLQDYDFEYFWILPDDIRIKPNFFELSVGYWNLINDPQKICLSVGHTHNRHYKPNWTRFQPISMGAVILTQWNDMCFMAERRFLETLNFKIEKPLPGYNYASSGVGRYISKTLYGLGYNMYHLDESLCEFPANESRMHL